MRITLEVNGDNTAAVNLKADTDAERAILALLSDGRGVRWESQPRYEYLPSRVESVVLYRVPTGEAA